MEMLKPVAEDARTSENFAALCNNVCKAGSPPHLISMGEFVG